MNQAPTINDILALRESLGCAIYRTPIMQCAVLEEIVGGNTQIHAKLEFLQRTGAFKARGALAAEVVMVNSAHDAFSEAERIQSEEGRFFVHPFEGREVATGTGMVGLEIHEQCPEFDAVLVSVGGGGLIGGISNALKQLRPECELIGVEPEGADSMHRSFAAGTPQSIDSVATIADSRLGRVE